MSIVQHLVVDGFGVHVGKYSERLKVTQRGETLSQAPLLHLQTVTLLNLGISVSADAIECCTERGIPIFFLDGQGNPYATLYAAGLAGTVITRREQLRAYDDQRGVRLGQAFTGGKIVNQSITLKYLAKTRKDTPEGDALLTAATEVMDHLVLVEAIRAEKIDDCRASIMAAEGGAARRYWEAVRAILPAHYEWMSREGRGAIDPINSLLNYGYGILQSQIERALVVSGLDPYAGFVHADRPGKESLTLDLIEEFRPEVVDRVVFGLANRDFNVGQDEQKRLTSETRKAFAERILAHLETEVRYEGGKLELRKVVQSQARRLAAFLRGENTEYTPYKASW